MPDKQDRLSPGVMLRRLCEPTPDPLDLPPTALVLAHPDDETIGAGSRLALLGERATLIYATDGAPHDMHDARAAGFTQRLDYAAARRAELGAALNLAGLSLKQTIHLGLVDQEASRRLATLARALAGLFQQIRPGLVITHPYEGGHPDHDAVAFAVHAACRLSHDTVPLVLVEMTSYHAGRDDIEVGEFLSTPTDPQGSNKLAGAKEELRKDPQRRRKGPQSKARARDISSLTINRAEPLTIELDAAERRLKDAMLACFTTQRQTLGCFPTSRERFRLAPEYDFTQPPHEGLLFYEHYPWGMDGPQWRSLARQALEELGCMNAGAPEDAKRCPCA